MKRLILFLFLPAIFGSAAESVQADVRLPKFMGDHMVLQRDADIPIWGWATPGEAVTVKLGEQSATATADDKGAWRVSLPKRAASATPSTLTVSGKNKITLTDILIGEVWLCSGQSNMEWTVNRSTNAAEEIANAKYPQIRHLGIPKSPNALPQSDIAATWLVCAPETAGGFTAAGYFMARELFKKLDVPIGLIHSSWGGTRIEPWTPPVGFSLVPELSALSEEVAQRSPGTAAHAKLLQSYVAQTEAWLALAKAQGSADGLLAASPAYPSNLKPLATHGDPTGLYNGMIHPFVGWPIRGAIWYQGESNSGEGMLYRAKMEALIAGWRKVWGIGDFPFYFVQIAPYTYGNAPGNVLAQFWEAQAESEKTIPNTGMIVINDVATLNDIHPPNKQDVGLRLAYLALNRTYGKKDVVDSGAKFKSLETVGDELVLTFESTAGGLKSRDGKPLSWFEIIGPTKGWTKADAKINGDKVILSAAGMTAPAAVRFAWDKLAEPNLVNGAGLPSSAFRGGIVPTVDFLKQIEEANGYQVVYDLDLAKLGKAIVYDVDNTSMIKAPFDRIAYLVELQSNGGIPEYVFVSMDAFTKDLAKTGVPVLASGAIFQQKVSNLNVASNVTSLKAGSGLDGGNIEFWPHNYAKENLLNIPGASSATYDFGDNYNGPADGYGSMQVHHFKAGQTVFAINHWIEGASADIGIGNSTSENPDWTFTRNGSQYSSKRLRVLVRPTKQP